MQPSDSMKPGPEQGKLLLALARDAINQALDLPRSGTSPTPGLAADGACFVTLRIHGELRGCIGSLNAHRPLGQDVRDNAVSAALRDPRFPPLTAAEFASVQVEVSLLTEPDFIEFRDEADALAQLVPGRDGVIFFNGCQRATFLPQVWEQLPEADDFLRRLWRKAGMQADLWDDEVRLLVYTAASWAENGVERHDDDHDIPSGPLVAPHLGRPAPM